MMLSDVVMPGKDGLALLEELRKPGHRAAGGDDLRAGQHRDGGARHAAGRGGFPREAALHRQAAAHRRQRPQAEAPGGGEPRAAPARRQARDRAFGRSHAARDGAGGPRGRQRSARLHPGRNRHRQGADRARAARAQSAARRAVRHPELRRRAGRADRIGAVRPRKRLVHRRGHAAHRASSNRPTTARCSWTRSATCRW